MCTFDKFTELSGVADLPEGHETIQQALDRLESWTDKNVMKFFKDMCLENKKVLHLGRSNSSHQSVLGDTQMESSSARKGLGVLVNTKLNTSQQYAPLPLKRLVVFLAVLGKELPAGQER